MMQNNIKIAITGGICSGKSTVAEIIKEQGYKVYSCDEIYRELLIDTNFIDLLDSEFGGVKKYDGTLDRAKLSEIVFNDSEKLNKLNSLTHPKILQRAMDLMSGRGIYFCEVPLLFEGGFEKLFDNVIVVLRDKNERVKELMKRDKLEEKSAILRLNSQFDYEINNFIEYYVIHNCDNLIELHKNVVNVIAAIIKDYN